MEAVREKLSRLGLLRTADEHEAPSSLLALCNAALLEGGLSVALDVRPDELIGPLAIAIGDGGRNLKVLDARDEPRPELIVCLGGLEKTWTVGTLEALVEHLNELFRAEPEAKAVATLGEYEDALQLWVIDKAMLGRLLEEDFFRPLNRRQLAKLAQPRTSC